MIYEEYYNNNFKNDLNQLHQILIENEAPHIIDNRYDILYIQLPILNRDSGYLDFIENENIINFAICLYYRILVDQLIYYNYVTIKYKRISSERDDSPYFTFQKISKHPKLIGPCLAACHHNQPPYAIFDYINKVEAPGGDYYKIKNETIIKREKIDLEMLKITLHESMNVMESKIINYFNRLCIGDLEGIKIWALTKTRLEYDIIILNNGFS